MAISPNLTPEEWEDFNAAMEAEALRSMVDHLDGLHALLSMCDPEKYPPGPAPLVTEDDA